MNSTMNRQTSKVGEKIEFFGNEKNEKCEKVRTFTEKEKTQRPINENVGKT